MTLEAVLVHHRRSEPARPGNADSPLSSIHNSKLARQSGIPMRRRRHIEEAANHDRWLVSYSDFVTLLFAFFVVLFASAYRDNHAIIRVSNAIHNGFQTLGAFKRRRRRTGRLFRCRSGIRR